MTKTLGDGASSLNLEKYSMVDMSKHSKVITSSLKLTCPQQTRPHNLIRVPHIVMLNYLWQASMSKKQLPLVVVHLPSLLQ